MSRLQGPDVVAAWGTANAVLLAVLIGYGDSGSAIAVYAASTGLIELVALVTWAVICRRPDWAARSPAPARSRASALAAAVVALVGAGVVWDWWIALPAVYPFAALLADRDGPRRLLRRAGR